MGRLPWHKLRNAVALSLIFLPVTSWAGEDPREAFRSLYDRTVTFSADAWRQSREWVENNIGPLTDQIVERSYPECQFYDIDVRFGPKEETFYEEVGDPESGKRFDTKEAFLLEFMRSPQPGEVCARERTDKILCLASGQKVERPADCGVTNPRRGTDYRVLPRCLRSILFDRIDSPTELRITGQVPRFENQFVDCNAPEAQGAETARHNPNFRIKAFIGIPYLAVIRPLTDHYYRDCHYNLHVREERVPLTEDGHCLSDAAQAKLQAFNFWVVPDERPAFERETEGRAFDWSPFYRQEMTEESDIDLIPLQAFRMKEGIKVRPDEVFTRYAEVLKVRKEDRFEAKWSADRHTWHQQMYQGYPVEGRGYMIQADGDRVVSVLGQSAPNLEVDLSNPISEEAARALALAAVPATEYPADPPAGELLIIPERPQGLSRNYRLAWRFQVLTNVPPGGATVYLDAKTGEVLYEAPLIQTSDPVYEDVDASGQTLFYGLQPFKAGKLISVDPLAGDEYGLSWNGPPLTRTYQQVKDGEVFKNEIVASYTPEFTDPLNPVVADGATLHWGLQQCLRYFKERLGWIGMDGLGQVPVRGFLLDPDSPQTKDRFGDLQSAFFSSNPASPWMGFVIPDAEGLRPVDLDVACHEFTHGVDYFAIRGNAGQPSGLDYVGESGALNEGISDLFAVLSSFYGGGSEAANWLLGEALYGGTNSIRDLSNPEIKERPKTYRGIYFDFSAVTLEGCKERGRDRCGVHTNSSVLEYWFYLLANGGSGKNDLGEDFQVEAIGIEMAERLLWHMVRTKLRPTDTFYRARVASEDAAADLFGPQSASPNEMVPKSVKDAWHAVGVGGKDEGRYYRPEMGTKVDPWPVGLRIAPRPDDTEYDVRFFPELGDQSLSYLGQLWTAPENSQLRGNDYNFPPDTKVTWRIRAKKESGEWGPWSEVMYFVTEKKRPELISPSSAPPLMTGGGTSQLTVISPWANEFEWRAVGGAEKYYLNVREVSGEDCIPPESVEPGGTRVFVETDAAEGESVVTGLALKPETEYSWSVTAVGPEFDFPSPYSELANYRGSCSEMRRFKTSKPEAPQLVSPAEGAPNHPGQPITFEWTPVEGAAQYRLLLAPRSAEGEAVPVIFGFVPLVREIFVAAPEDKSSNVSIEVADPPNHRDGLCWAVQAIGPDNSRGELSDYRCHEKRLEAPKISSPDNGAYYTYSSYASGAAKFYWLTVPGATGYELTGFMGLGGQSTGSVLGGIVVPAPPPEDTRGYTSHPLNAIPTYHGGNCWSVRGIDFSGKPGLESETACYNIGPSRPGSLSHDIGSMDVTTNLYPVYFSWQNVHDPGGHKVVYTVTPKYGNATTTYEIDHGPHVIKEAAANILANARVVWKVVAPDPYQTSQFYDQESDVQEFEMPPVDEEAKKLARESEAGSSTTQAPSPCESLAAPVPLAPGFVTLNSTHPTLTFLEVPDADYYLVDVWYGQLATQVTGFVGGNIYNADTVQKSGGVISVTSPVSLPDSLVSRSLYVWCVRAKRGTGCTYEQLTPPANFMNCQGAFGVQLQ